ncbi:MAG: hydrogenase [Candidatus Korarchaeota archaeon]|nr:hydrogenase [Candidatus Korarchaeota archaeon]NIU82703.1 hydrogenase [Candidatus Thorarchaeota archaeon]NIW13194.1 hydrogenase [Candidatus Thorarchaeota archaeon]NIW51333.1 hydrogenase [Candidatus Korarchaeota archaeon]
MRLPLGKLNPQILQKRVINHIITDDSVLNPPAIGEDGAVFRTTQNIIVAASDPITGEASNEKIGRLSVHVNANDIYVHAASPRWYLATILLPESEEEDTVGEIMEGIQKGINEVGANLIGGHTELTKKVNAPILSGFMIGEPMVNSKFIRSAGGREDDRILMTKGAGIEGTAILAHTFENELQLKPNLITRAKKFEELLSVKSEVEILVKKVGIDHISSMHDATEGGVLGAVYELATASGIGFELWGDKILVKDETRHICRSMNVNPLKLISSGTLLVALPKNKVNKAVNTLNNQGIETAVIGKLTAKGKYLTVGRTRQRIKKAPLDEIWRIFSSPLDKGAR